MPADAGRARIASRADLDALIALEQRFPSDRLSRRSFRHFLSGAHADVLVFQEQTGIVADLVVLYRRHSTQARLYSLVVHPAYQQRGIARHLLQAAEQAALRRGMRRMSLEVRPDNSAALSLYKKLGYTVVKQLDDYYQDHTSALRMVKHIG